LVSVRNPLEARAAVAGGCDVLDIKEPSRGPLGMADPEVMAAIADFAAGCRGGVALPVSAALGELVDWQTRASDFSVPPGIEYVKFGSAGLDSTARWIEAWHAVQGRLKSRAPHNLQWVAVAYADWRAARGVEPRRLLDGAQSAACDVLLVDTFDKGAGSLPKLMEAAELRQLCDAAHQAGLKIALAGRLRRAHFSALVEAGPDILGVRGTACAGGSRTAPISANAVRALKRELLASVAAG
jgi:(5-formylfuran-3-yl)methyl phosphate synthase